MGGGGSLANMQKVLRNNSDGEGLYLSAGNSSLEWTIRGQTEGDMETKKTGGEKNVQKQWRAKSKSVVVFVF